MVDERLILSQGIDYMFVSMPQRQSTAVGVWVKEGGRSEPGRYKGIAHFMEHLLFKGSRRYSYRKIKEEVEGKGGQLNGFTAQEATCYYARVLNRNVDRTLDVLLDMVLNPLLKESDVERERQVVLEEINMYNDMPSSRVFSLLDTAVWPYDPLGQDVIGTPETVGRVTRDTLRQFKQRVYVPRNLAIVISGVAPRDLQGVVSRALDGSSRGRAVSFRANPEIPRGFTCLKEVKPFNQTHLAMAFPGVDARSEDRFSLELLHTVLGSNMSSRLFESVREKRGLAYDVSTSVRRYCDTGVFNIHCGLDARNAVKAFKLIVAELDRMRNEPVPARELKRAREYLLGSLLVSLESPTSVMLYVGDSIVCREDVLTYRQLEERIMAVTADDILALARRIFDYDYCKSAIVTNEDADYEQAFRRIVGRQEGGRA
jgi:predicted Zn-dependent peptidase